MTTNERPSAVGTLEDAVALACEKFRGHVDSQGKAYVLHLLRVMLQISAPESQTAAVLHDIVEDTDVDLGELRSRGFSEDVVEAVDCLTHRAADSYADYVVRLSRNPIAKLCKRADLNDNYRLDRVKYRLGNEADDARRIQRYILSYRFLGGEIDEAEYRRRMLGVE